MQISHTAVPIRLYINTNTNKSESYKNLYYYNYMPIRLAYGFRDNPGKGYTWHHLNRYLLKQSECAKIDE